MFVQFGRWSVLMVGIVSCCSAAPAPAEDTIRKSVVRIYTTQRSPDWYHPWKKEDPSEISGSGVVIEGQRILTNAHVVHYASQIFVEPYQSGTRLAAKVQAIAPDIDLAILTVDEPTFFEHRPPLARTARLPEIKDTVHVYGYPNGGQALSITKGIVSRIEFDLYYFETSGLRIQVDAAINPGNSGGPALVDDQMIGLIFSKLQQSDNIGYIIPNIEIELFLKDVADGKYDGKPIFFETVQHLNNDALRALLKLDKETHGVLVCDSADTQGRSPFKPWDVITKIGDCAIDDTGKVRAEENLHLDFQYLVQELAENGTLSMELLRDGRRIRAVIPVSHQRDTLITRRLTRYPTYLVWGPLVFSTASSEYVEGYDNSGWMTQFATNASPLFIRRHDRPRFEGEELVVVTSMFPHRVSKGQSDPSTQVIAKVNDVPIRNIRHLAATLRDAKDEFVIIQFAEKNVGVLVYNRRQILEASEEILTENGVRNACSDDLRDVWEQR